MTPAARPSVEPHPLFLKSLARRPWGPAQGFLSTGGIFYRVSGGGVETRAHLYNYFPLLAGGPFEAEWTVRAYAQDGRRWRERKGRFDAAGRATVLLNEWTEGLGDLGVCVAHIRPLTGRLGKSFDTLTFTEYRAGASAAYLHSMGYPVPKPYVANDYLATSIPAGGDPALIVADASDRPFGFFRRAAAGARVWIRNDRGEEREAPLPALAPLACRMTRLREIWTDLDAFARGGDVLLRVRGANLLYSPLFWMVEPGKAFAVEHFQALDWEGA